MAGVGEARLGWGAELCRHCAALQWGGLGDWGGWALCGAWAGALPVMSDAWSQWVLLEAGCEEACPGERGRRFPPGFSVWHGEGRAPEGEAQSFTSVNLVKGICRGKEKPLGQESADPV